MRELSKKEMLTLIAILILADGSDVFDELRSKILSYEDQIDRFSDEFDEREAHQILKNIVDEILGGNKK